MVAIASRDGSDCSGTVRPKAPNDGALWYDQTNRMTLVFDAISKIWFPASGESCFVPFTATSGLFHDAYKAVTLSTRWTVNRGTDTSDAISFAIESYGVGAMTTGNGGTGFASDGVYKVGLTTGNAATVAKRYVERIKISAITNVSIFMGFTDTASFEEPMSLSTTTFTTTATDAVGFVFDTAATIDTIRCHAVKADADYTTPVDTGLAFVADTYMELAVELDTDGTARLYIDGTLVATLATCVSTNVALYPVLTATARSTAVRKLSSTLGNVTALAV